jgi:hypothetical protein
LVNGEQAAANFALHLMTYARWRRTMRNLTHSILELRGLITIVPKKKKLKKFTATSAVKAASRAVLGTPPPVKRAENKKHAKKDKHKPSLGKLLADADRG